MENKNVTSQVISIDDVGVQWIKTLVSTNGTSVRVDGDGESPNEGSAPYDEVGAMHYVVAVILIYSSAVIGVFILGFFSRRHKETLQIDEQADYFLKDINQTRIVIERQQRKTSIRQYARSISLDPALLSSKGETVRTGVLSIALPMTSVAVNNEESSPSHISANKQCFRVSNGTHLNTSREQEQSMKEDDLDRAHAASEEKPLLENGDMRLVRHAHSFPPDRLYKNVQDNDYNLPTIREEIW